MDAWLSTDIASLNRYGYSREPVRFVYTAEGLESDLHSLSTAGIYKHSIEPRGTALRYTRGRISLSCTHEGGSLFTHHCARVVRRNEGSADLATIVLAMRGAKAYTGCTLHSSDFRQIEGGGFPQSLRRARWIAERKDLRSLRRKSFSQRLHRSSVNVAGRHFSVELIRVLYLWLNRRSHNWK